MLNNFRIASPCQSSWDSMEGTNQKRFCRECSKHVYNISAMTQADAEKLLSSGERVCGRFYRRLDGTILTEDCPVGWRANVQRVSKRLSFAISGALGLATAFGQGKPPEGVHIRAEQSTQLEIVGTISDPVGSVIAGSIVTVTDLETGKAQVVRSDDRGRFRVPAEDEAYYEVKVESPGFRLAIISRLYVPANHRRVVDVTLLLGTVGEVVEVQAKK
jgi:hypothetical protein